MSVSVEEIEGTDRMDYARRPIALATRTIPSDEGDIVVVQMAGCGSSPKACLFVEPESQESISAANLGERLADGTYGGIAPLSEHTFLLWATKILVAAFDGAMEVFASEWPDDYQGDQDRMPEPESKLLGTRFYVRPLTEEERGEFIVLLLGTDFRGTYSFWEG